MRVNQHSELNGMTGVSASSQTAESRLERDRLAFAGAEALNQALQQTPPLRAEEVARAKELLKSSDYPSPVVTAQVASLLAQYMGPKSG
jgi:hypothetical protein